MQRRRVALDRGVPDAAAAPAAPIGQTERVAHVVRVPALSFKEERIHGADRIVIDLGSGVAWEGT